MDVTNINFASRSLAGFQYVSVKFILHKMQKYEKRSAVHSCGLRMCQFLKFTKGIAVHRKTYERQELFLEGRMSTREIPGRRPSTVKCVEINVRTSAFRHGHICIDC
jgi:hypothetical protein